MTLQKDPMTFSQDPALAGPATHALESQLQALEIAHRRARMRFDYAPQATFVLDARGRVHDLNRRALSLLDAQPDALSRRGLAAFLTPASRSALTSLLKSVFSTIGPHRGELHFLKSDGTVLEMSAEVVRYSEDEEDTCQLALTDMTAANTAQRALLDANLALKAQVQTQAVRMRQVHEECERVILASAKELRASVTRAQNFLALAHLHAADEAGEPTNVSRAEHALHQTQGLLSSLEQFMAMKGQRTRVRSVKLNEVFREVCKDLAPSLEGRDVQLSAAPLPVVDGDSQVLQVILKECLSNALKFTRKQKVAHIRVLARETETAYVIGVEDNGVGFNMRQREKPFELFGRLHPSSEYEGAGIGLAIVRSLCERFGGRTWAEGQLDQGATFWFAWPKSLTLI